ERYHANGFRIVVTGESEPPANDSVASRPVLPPPRLQNATDPTDASRDVPFVNSLGMKFVPVPGTGVLFCIHETRWRDYAAFAGENTDLDDSWRSQSIYNIAVASRADEHPIWKVSWEDAKQFCDWLS